MKRVLLVDCETTGLDREKDHVIELGYVLWSVEHRTMLEVYSGLLPCAENSAEAVNGIPASVLGADLEAHKVWGQFIGALCRAEAVVAHQADFDREVCRRGGGEYQQSVQQACDANVWICTIEDMKWPRNGAGRSLVSIALAHGVAVVAAHRAVNDCLTLARLFEAIPDIAERLEVAYQHALLPKGEVVSLAPYEEKDIVKQNGFRWYPDRRVWARHMTLDDAKSLPFRTRGANG